MILLGKETILSFYVEYSWAPFANPVVLATAAPFAAGRSLITKRIPHVLCALHCFDWRMVHFHLPHLRTHLLYAH